MKQAVFSKNAPQPVGSYSQAISIGNFLFASGQIPLNPKNDTLITGDIQAQTTQIMNNILAVLKSHKMDFSHVVKTTIFLTKADDFASVNSVYSSFFTQPFPARSCVTVKALPKNAAVEIEVIAYKQ